MPRRRRLSRPIGRRWLGAFALALVGVSIILIEALRSSHRHPHLYFSSGSIAAPPVLARRFTRALELSTGVRIEPGNRVELLLNGNGTYPELWRDLSEARSTISMQMYYALPGRVADTLARLLCDRARHRVDVRLLLDAFGSAGMPRSWIKGLSRCGVGVALLRPLEWFTIHNASERSHVRAVVVDGRIGYTGGFGLADYWLGDGHHSDQWRETNIRFEGPVVDALQSAFAAGWREATGEWLDGDAFFAGPPAPSTRTTPGMAAGVLFAQPTTGTTSAEQFLTLAILGARSRLYITNSYFVPNGDFRRLLVDAAQRGVDVRILTAGPLTDVKTPWLAGRSYYEELRSRGVRVYEYQPAMLHAKTIVVDGYWSTVGSMNFDNHSLAVNDESNLVVIDSTFGAMMDSVFFDDLCSAKEMTPSVLAARSVWQRALEAGAAMLSRIL